MKNVFLLFLSLFFANLVSAQEFEVLVENQEVIMGESFDVTFKIVTESDDEPQITFDPEGLEVLGRSNRGTSIITTNINGRITRSREVTMVYEMVANSKGRVKLSNIKVELDQRKIGHADVTLRVVESIQKLDDFFALAVPSKTRVYLGESIILRYYIYKKIQIPNFDIKKYPKLDGYLKRFVQEPLRDERVNYNGQIYVRSILYTVQLFPEKIGDLEIDPIKLTVHYPARNMNDPFGSFGLGLGMGYSKLKTKSIGSAPVKVTVMALPAKSVPPHFTGLVGQHELSFQLMKNKFLINEPVEAKLIVKGMGVLENFDAPVLIKNSGLEEFESSADLVLNQDFSATKTFQYTFIARQNFSQEQKAIPLSYFDPEKMEYITIMINVPPIEVAGGKAVDNSIAKSDEPAPAVEEPNRPAPLPKIVEDLGIIGPEFEPKLIRFTTKTINLLLLAIIVVLFGGNFYQWIKPKKMENEYENIFREIKSKGLNYSRLFHFLSGFKNDENSDLLRALQNSTIDEKVKKYFLDLVQACEKNQFYMENKDKKMTINNKYFIDVLNFYKNRRTSASSRKYSGISKASQV
ncbi:MAG: BatD family protein [Bacteriovoracaceae bacterium]|nr:BatD family protein [Bacteriovoracaceae bacterium]